MTPSAALDLTLLNTAPATPAKAVLRKKHSPDDDLLTGQAGDEAALQLASTDTLNEVSASTLGQPYQLAQANLPTLPDVAPPVLQSTNMSPLLLGGVVAGVAALAGGGGSSSSAAPVVPVVPATPTPTPTPVADTTPPTITNVAITGASGVQNGSLKAGDVVNITITLNEATLVTTTGGTPQLALNIGGSTVQANYAAGSGSTALVFTYTLQTGQTDTNGISIAANSLSLNGGTLKDAAGNAATLSHALVADNPAYLVDTLAPTVLITSNIPAVKAGDTATVTFTFSEAPTGFTASDITTTGGTLSSPTVSASDPKVFTATFTPTPGTAAANASITVAASSYTDTAGNGGSTGGTPAIGIDTLAPTLVITSNIAAVKAGETATVTFTFSEAPTGFTASDITTTGGALSTPTVSATDPNVYTASFTTTGGTAANASITVAAGSYTDAAGNGGGAGGTSATPAAPAIVIDTSIHNIVDGIVTAGPVIPGNGLTVNLYKADGTTLLGSGPLSAAGQFHIDVHSYTGAVIAKVIDANAGADYVDEATGLAKDLNAILMAVGMMTNGVITLNINPVTTIAAIKAGMASDGSGHVSATSVADANTAVAAAFGLGDITTTAPVLTVSTSGQANPDYNPNDGLSAAEKYGAVLAAISGNDRVNTGNTQVTINQYATAISGTGAGATLNATGQAALNEGAAAADPRTAGDLGAVFETQPTFSIAVNGAAQQTEGSNPNLGKAFNFTITRSSGNVASAVDYVVDGVAGLTGATANDFGVGTTSSMPHGTVDFAIGDISKIIPVSVAGDAVFEYDENFTVTLQNPTNATLGTNTSVQATIVNDDHATLTAAQIFTAQGVNSAGDNNTAGYIRVMADFSKAAYDLQPWETSTVGGRAINDVSPLANKALDGVLAEGWELLTLNPTLNPSSLATPDTNLILNPGLFTVVNRMDNGFYTNGNAAALVARSTDSLVISFRGTNDNAGSDPNTNPADTGNVIHPDVDQWGAPNDFTSSATMLDHYALFNPLFDAIAAYVNSPGSNINHIYVTGHSLGGAMAIAYMASQAGNNIFNSVTFAAPAFTINDSVDVAFDTWLFFTDNRLIQIEIDEDPVPQASWLATDRPGQVLTFAGNNTGDKPDSYQPTGHFNADNHTMDYYRQITQSVDPDSWQKIVAQTGDQSIAIGAASGPAYFTPIANRDFNQYDTSFRVDGRITDTVDGRINVAETDTALANDTLTSGFGHLLDDGIYYGGQGNDILTGGITGELFLGGVGNDVINGGGGADTLEGGAGDDVLNGGTGADRLDGGTGADNFVFAKDDTGLAVKEPLTDYRFLSRPDVIVGSGFSQVGDKITFSGAYGDPAITPTMAPSSGVAADNRYFLERGDYNGTLGFLRNSIGNDTLVVFHGTPELYLGDAAFVIQGVTPNNLTTGESVIYYGADTTAPTLTITTVTSGTATGPVVYGFNFSEPVTGFTADDVVTAGVKAQLIQTDDSHYTMTVIPPTGSGTMYVGVNAGAVTDLAGNPNTLALSDPQAYAPAPATAPYVPGQAVIDLGADGNLIAPVQVEGNWYYFWDRSGDFTNADTGSLNGGVDYTTHDVLDGIFNHDINGVTNTSIANADGAYGTTDTYRYGTVNGVSLALPTAGGQYSPPYGVNGIGAYQPGTAVSSGATTNATYNDLLAIWDAYNGSGTGTGVSDTPAVWGATGYWSATPSAAGHGIVHLDFGFVGDGRDYVTPWVAVQVLPPDTTAPTFTSASTATLAENTPTSTTVYDATADGDVGVSYTLTGADAVLFNIAAATGLVTFKTSPDFEAPADAGANNIYDFTVTATDASNNATAKAVQLTVTDVAEAAYTLGQNVIPLGAAGNLIKPVQVEGKWYYFWDLSGDGTSGGVDYTTHDVLDGIFKYASDFTTVNPTYAVGNAAADDTTDTYRFATINGVNVALPTANGGVAYPQGLNQYQNGTSYTDAGLTTNGTTSSFNDLLAVWDAYNGTGTAVNGTPAGWQAINYWSATPSASGHAFVYLDGGSVFDSYDYYYNCVALQVL